MLGAHGTVNRRYAYSPYGQTTSTFGAGDSSLLALVVSCLRDLDPAASDARWMDDCGTDTAVSALVINGERFQMFLRSS